MEAMAGMVNRTRESELAAAVAGDEVAFRRIIIENHEDMRRVCFAIARDHGVADDATQAAWLIAWRKLGNVRDAVHLRPWLVSVAANETKRLLRKRTRRAEVEVRDDVAGRPGSFDPATGIESVDLRAAMLRLDPDDRALIAMRYGAGFDSTELGIATGKSPAAVRQRLKRALDRLRKDLADG
jgi:RNA polymerase sigma-70 factor (ECF subfamily)